MGKFGTSEGKKILTPEQRRAIIPLLTQGIAAACIASKRSKSTIYRWLRQENFQAALIAAEVEALSKINRGLLQLSGKTIQALSDGLSDSEIRTRVKTADIHLKNLLKYAEVVIFGRQIQDLEERTRDWEVDKGDDYF